MVMFFLLKQTTHSAAAVVFIQRQWIKPIRVFLKTQAETGGFKQTLVFLMRWRKPLSLLMGNPVGG